MLQQMAKSMCCLTIVIITWFITERRISPRNALFLGITIFNFYHKYFPQFIMSVIDQEAGIILAIEAIRSSKNISRRRAAAIYEIPKATLRKRINGRSPRSEHKPNYSKLNQTEEEVLSRYILDFDARGFSPDFASMKDMVNLILASRGGKHVGKL